MTTTITYTKKLTDPGTKVAAEATSSSPCKAQRVAVTVAYGWFTGVVGGALEIGDLNGAAAAVGLGEFAWDPAGDVQC